MGDVPVITIAGDKPRDYLNIQRLGSRYKTIDPHKYAQHTLNNRVNKQVKHTGQRVNRIRLTGQS